MRSSILRALALTVIAQFVLAGCGGDDGGSSSGSGSGSGSASAPAEDEFDQEAFCDAAGDFATASDGAARTPSTPDEVEERLTAMSGAADAIVEAAPEDVTEDAQAFADAIDGLEQYGADRDYEVDLGGASPRVPVR